MGITKELGESPNLVWHLNNMNGHEFENWIYNILTKIMKDYFDSGTTIVPTPGSGDNGKDMIIKSPVNLYNIFYQNFSLKNKDNMTIYVECKSTDSPKLKFDKIISNVIRAKYDHIDYFVLITNATIIPDTYHKIDIELKQHNIDFVLVDQYLLAKTIYEMGMKEKESIPLSKKNIDFCCQYQVQPFQDDEDKMVFDVPMLFRNYTPKNRTVTVKLFTDENWEMDQKNHSIILPPYGSGIRKFTFKHISYDGIDELKLYIKNQDNESVVPIQGLNYKEVFIPQFTGERHRQILYHLHKAIPEQRNSAIYYLWGETGIGKSRIVVELFKLLSGRNYDLKKINLSARVDDPTVLIGDFLYEKNYIAENFENLCDMMKSASHEFRNALIVLEDFHYAAPNFAEQLKLIDGLNIPISIIVCGRDDYSVGSLNYFSFIQWTLENKKENSWEVKPFLPEETEKFIRIMINGIPTEVLSAIHAKSMNNPLYIVQYIEYLLDINMVSLQNRNTVGILNIDTFPTKDSIPNEINTIYKKRLSHLIDIYGENTHLSVLLLLTVFGGEIPIGLINDYFDLENDEIEELVKRRFIKYGKNKSILLLEQENEQVFTNINSCRREEMAREDKLKALDAAISQIEKQYGKGSIMKLGDSSAQMNVETIPTGALSLDIALGLGGLPKGRIIEIYGPESSGKTTVALHAVAEVQRRGGIAGFIDAEHALDPAYAKNIGVDIDNLYISQPDCGEQALEITETMVRSGAVDIVIVDSVAALVPKAEIDGDMGDSHVGLQARLMSQALRKLTAIISKSNCSVVFINQLREKVGIMFGNPETTTGGRALKFYSSVRMDVRRIESLKQGGEVIGNRTRVKVVKNKIAPPFKEAEFDIMFGEGISVTGDILDLAADVGIINKSGAWYAYEGNKIGQGRENAKQYLKDNPAVCAEVEAKVREHYGLSGNVTDEM